MNVFTKASAGLFAALIGAAAVATYKPILGHQVGNPGVGMEVIDTRERLAAKLAANEVPEALPPASQDGLLAVDAYKNVQVLGHLSSGEMTRLMTAITTWVAPEAGCGYCHASQRDADGNVVKNDLGFAQADPNKMDSDELYTKKVARRMLEMTMYVNADWKEHVKGTGVTCYTCHRGNAVPAYVWFNAPEEGSNAPMVGRRSEQNAPSMAAGLSSLPNSAFHPFLDGEENIRVQAVDAIGSPDRSSIKQTEWTYSLMMHFSSALGVNCTYCHNSRSLANWQASPPTRAQAWYGIRMVRQLNQGFLDPLAALLPQERMGPLGDGPKVNCATCHQGAYKPLLGVSMLADYQALAAPKPRPPKTVVAPPQPVPSADVTAKPPEPAAPVVPELNPTATPSGSAAPPKLVPPPSP